MVSSIGGPGTVQQMSIEGLDLESMLMAVQTNRVNLMDQQLKDQMGAVQNRNNRINELNVGMNGMNAVLPKLGADATAELKDQNMTDFLAAAPQVVDQAKLDEMPDLIDRYEAGGSLAKYNVINNSAGIDLKDAMERYGYPVPDSIKNAQFGDRNRHMSSELSSDVKDAGRAFTVWLQRDDAPTPMTTDPKALACTSRAKAEAYIKTQQSEIDALGNSQQMDMLRLQSLSNKRNEAFEIMTNFMKKLADSRSGIIQKF